ncbi:hypothetical protein Tco_0338386, partial [Tanacetum coccineum]
MHPDGALLAENVGMVVRSVMGVVTGVMVLLVVRWWFGDDDNVTVRMVEMTWWMWPLS